MVQQTLSALRADEQRFEVHHINARFSEKLEDVGTSSLGKLLLSLRYLFQALRLRMVLSDPLLLYVPGPVKWSALLRDWLLLGVLRLFYRRLVFHWHAIGQGEWAHGSKRLQIRGPKWLDCLGRMVSRWVLEEPHASISVSDSSRKDAFAVGSVYGVVVPNGIEDPCPDFEKEVLSAKLIRLAELQAAQTPCFRLLFLSRGTEEKGLFDAIEALRFLIHDCPSEWRFEVTFAGGISTGDAQRFASEIALLEACAEGRFSTRSIGYVSGEEKRLAYLHHDIFLSPSRWESFGLTVLEAMAFGMPLVAAASDGVQGVLPRDYRWLSAVASPEEFGAMLADCCEHLLHDREGTKGRALRKRYLEQFQRKDFTQNVTNAFIELANHSLESPRRKYSSSPDPLATVDLTPNTQLPQPQSSTLSQIQHSPSKIFISVYLADQNPGHDRSFGISRMSRIVLEALQSRGDVEIQTIVSKTSERGPENVSVNRSLPWGTRSKLARLLSDHLHPLWIRPDPEPDVYFFPKGYLPFFHELCRPSVVTIHDTIIQYGEDHYPDWRSPWEYGYWAKVLKHTLRHADRIMTVSEFSKRQILAFMQRHGIAEKDILVTYEPCAYESIPQPVSPIKQHHVIHLASCEPHKRTAHLIRWWREAEEQGRDLPSLHLIGKVPPEVEGLLRSSRTIVKRPFLDDAALQDAYSQARALILPSEIEGFGLPALEAYYLGTPVCFVKGTSIEEILGVATSKGSFDLNHSQSLFDSLAEVMAMDPDEVRKCGLKLRETYAAAKVAEKMIEVFMGTANNGKAEENVEL
jgi:glycosyltransferase involved in cell wall biosynthesis